MLTPEQQQLGLRWSREHQQNTPGQICQKFSVIRRKKGQYLNHGEGGKEDEVDGSLLALNVEGDQEAHREEEGREEHPGVALHRLLHSRREQQYRTFDQKVTIQKSLYKSPILPIMVVMVS